MLWITGAHGFHPKILGMNHHSTRLRNPPYSAYPNNVGGCDEPAAPLRTHPISTGIYTFPRRQVINCKKVDQIMSIGLYQYTYNPKNIRYMELHIYLHTVENWFNE